MKDEIMYIEANIERGGSICSFFNQGAHKNLGASSSKLIVSLGITTEGTPINLETFS